MSILYSRNQKWDSIIVHSANEVQAMPSAVGSLWDLRDFFHVERVATLCWKIRGLFPERKKGCDCSSENWVFRFNHFFDELCFMQYVNITFLSLFRINYCVTINV